MKKAVFYVTFFAVATLFVACEEESLIQKNELPAVSRTFIETHFTGVEITAIVRERDGTDIDYTVYLANGFDIDFTKSGDWDDVDGHSLPVPESILTLLPQSLLQHMASTFPNLSIVEINRERYGYEIGLSNDLDLKFDSNGKFTGIND
ncbi:MAG: PepSY-like domain-containing protein [Tannerella sp.]|jgi:hypothetical protein|nr:PepSY-like domain-containing protein [Tannerella sp.]